MCYFSKSNNIYTVLLGITSIVAFMPTLAKQLGYSARTVGLIYTFFSVLNVLAKPISGIVVDNFPVKRVVFLSAILSCGLMVVMLNFIQVLPTKNAMHLSCDTNETILYICSFHDDNNAQSSLPKCDKDLSNLLESITVSVTCQVRNTNYIYYYYYYLFSYSVTFEILV